MYEKNKNFDWMSAVPVINTRCPCKQTPASKIGQGVDHWVNDPLLSTLHLQKSSMDVPN